MLPSTAGFVTIVLATVAASLIVAFRGETHLLIPLYAVGVFISFTLSQSSMVRRWFRLRSEGWWWRAVDHARTRRRGRSRLAASRARTRRGAPISRAGFARPTACAAIR